MCRHQLVVWYKWAAVCRLSLLLFLTNILPYMSQYLVLAKKERVFWKVEWILHQLTVLKCWLIRVSGSEYTICIWSSQTPHMRVAVGELNNQQIPSLASWFPILCWFHCSRDSRNSLSALTKLIPLSELTVFDALRYTMYWSGSHQ